MKPLAFSMLLLLGACAGAGAAPGAASRSGDQRQQDATVAACRQEAERAMRYRDRGQLMRTDEADARIGSGAFTDAVTGSMSTQRLSSRFEQGRLVDDCVRGTNATANAAQPAAAPAAAAAPAPEPAPVTPARRARGR